MYPDSREACSNRLIPSLSYSHIHNTEPTTSRAEERVHSILNLLQRLENTSSIPEQMHRHRRPLQHPQLPSFRDVAEELNPSADNNRPENRTLQHAASRRASAAGDRRSDELIARTHCLGQGVDCLRDARGEERWVEYRRGWLVDVEGEDWELQQRGRGR